MKRDVYRMSPKHNSIITRTTLVLSFQQTIVTDRPCHPAGRPCSLQTAELEPSGKLEKHHSQETLPAALNRPSGRTSEHINARNLLISAKCYQ